MSASERRRVAWEAQPQAAAAVAPEEESGLNYAAMDGLPPEHPLRRPAAPKGAEVPEAAAELPTLGSLSPRERASIAWGIAPDRPAATGDVAPEAEEGQPNLHAG